jgi:hypothetical protein
MPIHDWTKVPAGLFHDFHQSWSIRIKDALNAGLLPEDVAALVEHRAGPKEADVLTVEERPWAGPEKNRGLATLRRPQAQIVERTTKEIFARRANRIVLKHQLGRILAVIEIVSPGNKDGKAALREFVGKTIDYLRVGIHVLVIDLFPPTSRDPFGIHKAIWDEIEEKPFVFPEGKNRILVSYEANEEKVAYVEPVAVGDRLPEMPLFLSEDYHVFVPLEPTYTATWDATPKVMRHAVETGVLPNPDAD